MSNLKFKGKIILPTGLLILLILAAVLIVTIWQFNEFNDDLINSRIQAAAYSIRHIMDDTHRLATDVGLDVSMDQRMVNAMLSGDRDAVARAATAIVNEMPLVHWITAFDMDGGVYTRTHEHTPPGDVIRTPAFLAALDGIITVAYSPSGIYPIPVRSAVPVLHYGEVIGGVVVAHPLGTQMAVEYIASRHNAEITIFAGDTGDVRVASTITDGQGGTIVGTRMENPEILDTVFRQRREEFGTLEQFGESYLAFYLPLIDSDGVDRGTLALLLPMSDVYAQRTRTTIIAIVIGLVGLVLALGILALIAERLVRPVRDVQGVLANVANGNFAVNMKPNNSKDEIGLMTQDAYNVVNIIKNMVDDISKFAYESKVNGDIEYRIDASKYTGAYKEMLDSLAEYADDFSDGVIMLLNAIGEINNGNFDVKLARVLPGKKIVLNQTADALIANVKAVRGELGTMIDSVANEGDLTFQIDSAKYNGEWRDIMTGLNNLIKSVEMPVATVEICLSEMRKGVFKTEEIIRVIGKAGYETDVSKYRGVFHSLMVSVDSMAREVSSYIHEVSEVLAQMSGGNLQVKITRDYVGDFVEIKNSINNIAAQLIKTMGEITAASEYVLEGAKRITTSAMELADGSQAQAVSLEELNTTVEMINIQTRQFADNAREANTLSSKSTSNAQEGNVAMKQMLEAMMQIKESSGNISKIIKVIQDIAFQTNLLALNAAVEAARAGEHGKGFAVVAEEVRSLAARSQSAAAETTTLISDSITRVESGTSIAEVTSVSLDSIVQSAGDVLKLINNITEAANEQADTITQISTTLLATATTVQNNSKFAQESAATAEELNSQSEMLQQLVGFFKL